MLSAFAARKLAQAANAVPTQDSAVLSSQPKKPDAAEHIPLKRKSSVQALKPSKRKKNDSRPFEKPQKHHVVPDFFKAQEEIIVIDSDDDAQSEDSETFENRESKWSPGPSLEDSSDDDDNSTSNATPNPTADESPISEISLLKPHQNLNVFHLEAEELAGFGLSYDSGKSASVIALQPGESTCLLGTYSLTVIQGSVTLYGSTIPSSLNSHRIFAPRSSPLPLLTGENATGAVNTINSLPQRLHSLISTPVTLILVQKLHTGIEGLGRICRTFDRVFEPPRGDDDTTFPLPNGGVVFLVPSQTKDLQFLDLPESWKTRLSSLEIGSAPGVYLVKGPKNTGKSTFARLLTNTLLNRYQRVAYLECDIGQSEFTPGGMVALNVVSRPIFGPSFTHPTLPNYAHYIGMTTPRSSPSHYLASIHSLLETYRLDIRTPVSFCNIANDDERISDSIPLVINTMGWNKGLGGDLSLKIETMAEPTDIYEMEQPSDVGWLNAASNANVPPTLHHPQSKLHRLQPAPSSSLWTNYTAADHRSLSIISYFHAVFPASRYSEEDQEDQEKEEPEPSELQQITALAWRTSLPLCAHPPYEVTGSHAFDKVILTGAGSEDVVPSEINRVLNGALVGLVSCQPGALDRGGVEEEVEMTPTTTTTTMMMMMKTDGLPYFQADPPPSPAMSTCRGLALVRSIASSTSTTQMHVLTPVPVRLLAGTRVLVKGELEIPIWEMLDFRDGGGGDGDDGDDGGGEGAVAGVERGKVPYLQWGKGEGVGGERRRVRRNLMRRGQQ